MASSEEGGAGAIIASSYDGPTELHDVTSLVHTDESVDVNTPPSEVITRKVPSSVDIWKEIFFSCLPLGFVTFGGPQAHIGLLHEKFVVKYVVHIILITTSVSVLKFAGRQKWLDERRFIEL